MAPGCHIVCQHCGCCPDTTGNINYLSSNNTTTASYSSNCVINVYIGDITQDIDDDLIENWKKQRELQEIKSLYLLFCCLSRYYDKAIKKHKLQRFSYIHKQIKRSVENKGAYNYKKDK